jgi:membrane associated rhomboid family serine protease
MNAYRHLTIFFLIGLCGLVYVAEQSQQSSWAEEYGTVPTTIVQAFQAVRRGHVDLATLKDLSGLVSSIFLHGSPEHIVYNMLFLWTFGYLTSLYLGQWWALVIFVVCGVCGNVLQVFLNADSPIPIIGASGAISGFTGVYLGLALQWRLPNAEVWPLAYPVAPFQLGAFAVLGFLGDVYFLRDHSQHIAFGAHVGGFLTGFIIAILITTYYRSSSDFDRRWHRP